MSRIFTIFLCLLALAAVVFLAIYEPLTSSTREDKNARRDGAVFHLNPADVTEIRLTSSAGETYFKRHDASWTMGPSPKDRANSQLVEKILQDAANLRFFDRIRKSELHDDDQWGDYGLRNPKRKIEFRGRNTVTLYLGKDGADEDRLYVRPSDSGDIFLVSDDILDDAFPETPEFRSRVLTDLRTDDIQRITFRRPGGEIELVRDTRGWHMTKPLSTAADEKKIDDFLHKFLRVKITDFVADDSGDLGRYGITPGQNEISLGVEDSPRPQVLRLGAISGDGVLAQFTARDTVYKLPKETADLLAVSPESFRDRRLFPLNLDLVDLIRFHGPQGDFSLRRHDDDWTLVRPGQPDHAASAAAIRNLANALATTTVRDYQTASGEKLAASGLKPGQQWIEFVSVLTQNSAEAPAGERAIGRLVIGTPDQDTLPLRIDDSPEIDLVPAALLHTLSLDPSSWIAPQAEQKDPAGPKQ